MKKILYSIAFTVFITVILFLTIRGHFGSPTSNELTNTYWTEEGPFELSPERGRFAHLMSLIEDKSFSFSLPLSHFVLPDLGYKNGKFVSLFAPGVSFLVMPGYVLGKLFGVSQVGTFAMISIFALLNVLLIRYISIKLGANSFASSIAAIAFLFASPAFAYSGILYQHHISTFTILSSLALLLATKKIWPLIFLWILFGASVPIDYPNIFFMFPIALFAIVRIIWAKLNKEGIEVKINPWGFLTFFSVVLPLIFFMWFNKMSYGNPLQFSGTVERVQRIDETGKPIFDFEAVAALNPSSVPAKTHDKNATGFFDPRNFINGFYVHFLSPDRGILFYTPVMFLGILGAYFMFKKNRSWTALITAIIGTNILLYSMWGDPWGGWAFGSRYLIPTYSLLSIFIAFLLSSWGKKWLYLIPFFILFVYSVSVNSLGALTTNRIPPKGEAQALEKLSFREEAYSYNRNFQYIFENHSKSFFFQTFLNSQITAVTYYKYISLSIIYFSLLLLFGLKKSISLIKDKKHD